MMNESFNSMGKSHSYNLRTVKKKKKIKAFNSIALKSNKNVLKYECREPFYQSFGYAWMILRLENMK